MLASFYDVWFQGYYMSFIQILLVIIKYLILMKVFKTMLLNVTKKRNIM